MKLREVVARLPRARRAGAVIDYAFHMIIADPTRETLDEDIPALVKKGHASIKVFMTYDRLKVDDEQLARHARRGAQIRRHALRACREPRHHLLDGEAAFGARLHRTRNTMRSAMRASAEAEAFNRLIGMAALIDQPIMIFHVSTAEGAAVIRAGARGGAQGLRGNLSAISLPHRRGPRQAGRGRREMDVQPAAAHAPPTRRRCGRRCRSATSRPSRPIMRPIVSTRRQIARRPRPELQADRERHAGSGGAPAALVRRHGLEGAAGS